MHLPALRVSYCAGRGLGCFRDGEYIRVSTTAVWKDAIVSLGGVHRILFKSPARAGVKALVRSCKTTRAYGDVAACAMLLDGVADAWIEHGVQLWDLAATRILVEEAGGRFTDFAGRPDHTRGECVATNGLLHDYVLARLASARASSA
jgi:histidinol-phosphatase